MKHDRIVYGDELVCEAKECMKWYIKAFKVKARRLEYMTEFFGSYAVLKDDLDDVVEQGIIHFERDDNPKKKKDVSSSKIELFKIIAKIDEDANRWWTSINNGRTLIG